MLEDRVKFDGIVDAAKLCIRMEENKYDPTHIADRLMFALGEEPRLLWLETKLWIDAKLGILGEVTHLVRGNKRKASKEVTK